MENKNYLDYEGLKSYHEGLMKELNPQKIFKNQSELVDKTNWKYDGIRIYGNIKDIVVLVGQKIWRLDDPAEFQLKITSIGRTLEELSIANPEFLGWSIVASLADFKVEDNNPHTLQLLK